MKMRTNSTGLSLAAALCFIAVGCRHLPADVKVYPPKGQGYGYISVSRYRDMVHSYSYLEFYYWDAKGKRTRVWPNLESFKQTGPDAALFLGHLITGPSDPHPGMNGPLRLFAVQDAGPVIDVTDDVIRRWIIDDDRKFLEVIRNPLEHFLFR